jgi:hypothetical protein
MMNGATMHYTSCGTDYWHFTETIGGDSNSFKCNMDEEFDYTISGSERKVLMTRFVPFNL